MVQKPEDLQAMLDACRREALASFSDDRVLIEKYGTADRRRGVLPPTVVTVCRQLNLFTDALSGS